VCVIRMATDLSALGKLSPSSLQMVRNKIVSFFKHSDYVEYSFRV